MNGWGESYNPKIAKKCYDEGIDYKALSRRKWRWLIGLTKVSRWTARKGENSQCGYCWRYPIFYGIRRWRCRDEQDKKCPLSTLRPKTGLNCGIIVKNDPEATYTNLLRAQGRASDEVAPK